MSNLIKRKILMKQHLEKLRNVKKQITNPLSHIMCCKSYIFEKQYNTFEIKKTLDYLRHKINSNSHSKTISKNAIELVNLFQNLQLYNCYIYEDVLLWFRTDKCKNIIDKIALDHLNYKNNYSNLHNDSTDGILSNIYGQINENKYVQNTLHYIKIITQPLLIIICSVIINTILLYSIFSVEYRITIPITTLMGMITKSILVKNNIIKIVMNNLKTAKHITGIITMLCIFNFIYHSYNLYYNYFKYIELVYYKINKFHIMINIMFDIINMYKYDNIDGYNTVLYFKHNLSDLYENNNKEERNWWFFFRYGGTIMSDFYKISNKKNKLGKLFNINGQIAYLKII
jgi:hypothetical protein